MTWTGRGTTHSLSRQLKARKDSAIRFIRFRKFVLMWDDESVNAKPATVDTNEFFGDDHPENDPQPHETGDTDTHWANGMPRLLTPEAYNWLRARYPQPHGPGICPDGDGYSCIGNEPHDPAQVTEGGAQ